MTYYTYRELELPMYQHTQVWEKPVVSDEDPFFMLLVMTGTADKFLNALGVYHDGYRSIAHNIDQFEEAGKAVEPVTPDPRLLIFGKQRGQRNQLVHRLNSDGIFRKKYLGRTILATENDINTTVDGTSLTKTSLQKESDLMPGDYQLLIRASLKYMLAKANKLLGESDPSWKQLTSDMKRLRDFDSRVDTLFKPGIKYLLPIDFQSIDAFEVLKIDSPGDKAVRVTQTGPSIAVLHKSFAHLTFEVDEQGHMPAFDKAVEHYIWVTTESMDKRKYRLDRCPLGIYWATLFHSMAVNGMDVVMSVAGHDKEGVNLQEKYLVATEQSFLVDPRAQKKAWDEFEGPKDALERLQDGFHPESFALAIGEYKQLPDKPSDEVLFISCFPGRQPVYERVKRPRSLQ